MAGLTFIKAKELRTKGTDLNNIVSTASLLSLNKATNKNIKTINEEITMTITTNNVINNTANNNQIVSEVTIADRIKAIGEQNKTIKELESYLSQNEILSTTYRELMTELNRLSLAIDKKFNNNNKIINELEEKTESLEFTNEELVKLTEEARDSIKEAKNYLFDQLGKEEESDIEPFDMLTYDYSLNSNNGNGNGHVESDALEKFESPAANVNSTEEIIEPQPVVENSSAVSLTEVVEPINEAVETIKVEAVEEEEFCIKNEDIVSESTKRRYVLPLSRYTWHEGTLNDAIAAPDSVFSEDGKCFIQNYCYDFDFDMQYTEDTHENLMQHISHRSPTDISDRCLDLVEHGLLQYFRKDYIEQPFFEQDFDEYCDWLRTGAYIDRMEYEIVRLQQEEEEEEYNSDEDMPW